MTNCIQERLPFPSCKGRQVQASFSGGDITSNGGVLLLRQADRALGLTEQVAKALIDPRRLASCRHDALAIVRQRVYSLALGYEDLNDRSVAARSGAADPHYPVSRHEPDFIGKRESLGAWLAGTFDRLMRPLSAPLHPHWLRRKMSRSPPNHRHQGRGSWHRKRAAGWGLRAVPQLPVFGSPANPAARKKMRPGSPTAKKMTRGATARTSCALTRPAENATTYGPMQRCTARGVVATAAPGFGPGPVTVWPVPLKTSVKLPSPVTPSKISAT